MAPVQAWPILVANAESLIRSFMVSQVSCLAWPFACCFVNLPVPGYRDRPLSWPWRCGCSVAGTGARTQGGVTCSLLDVVSARRGPGLSSMLDRRERGDRLGSRDRGRRQADRARLHFLC